MYRFKFYLLFVAPVYNIPKLSLSLYKNSPMQIYGRFVLVSLKVILYISLHYLSLSFIMGLKKVILIKKVIISICLSDLIYFEPQQDVSGWNYCMIEKNFLNCNIFCIPESFTTNISHQLFDYKITFVNSQLEKTNFKSDFILKNRFETFVLNISGIKDKSYSDLVWRFQLISIEG